MSLTMPRNYGPIPGGDRRVECAYCGMTWYRRDCRRDAAGYIVCPDDMEGRDTVTLDRLNAAGATVRPRASEEIW